MSDSHLILEAGFDEAGRGPLAGPVCAAAVILPSDFPVEILNDSKKLTEKKRQAAVSVIKEKACYGIALVDHTTIDEINILEASMLAMKNAFEELMNKLPEWCRLQELGDFNQIKLIGIEGVVPSDETIADGTYPLINQSQVIIRADEPEDSILREIIEWITSEEGQKLGEENGYVRNAALQ